MNKRSRKRANAGTAIKRQREAEHMQAMLSKHMSAWLPDILAYMENLTNREKLPYIRMLLSYTVPRATKPEKPKQKPTPKKADNTAPKPYIWQKPEVSIKHILPS